MALDIKVDDREPKRVQEMAKTVFGDERVEIERMKSGDFVARGAQAAAERKQISDFLGSIGDKRIWKQTDGMGQQYEHNCVVVEGSHIEDFVADIYGGHAAAIRKVIGVVAWLNHQDGWSAMWFPQDGDEGTRLLMNYLEAWFRQADKKNKSK
ncbi:hypothetical protein HUG10_20670 (plasmid) [Halorarum halophilum]|uniref:ERCC4 domain-containing protein n=1 Tax=Halorarum halophilum TaxID=2743090 RepID=A0A7D5KQ19_9EURY|nr:ERCC4 domain-containing protein [Halobaculum halophilum]QLG30022.1 hypothetical protein HUG10_20670 [Halobaculum halophilum]